MSVFGEKGSHSLSNFLQIHFFLNFVNFDHIFTTYNQINDRNIWFAKVTIIIIMVAQVLLYNWVEQSRRICSKFRKLKYFFKSIVNIIKLSPNITYNCFNTKGINILQGYILV